MWLSWLCGCCSVSLSSFVPSEKYHSQCVLSLKLETLVTVFGWVHYRICCAHVVEGWSCEHTSNLLMHCRKRLWFKPLKRKYTEVSLRCLCSLTLDNTLSIAGCFLCLKLKIVCEIDHQKERNMHLARNWCYNSYLTFTAISIHILSHSKVSLLRNSISALVVYSCFLALTLHILKFKSL